MPAGLLGHSIANPSSLDGADGPAIHSSASTTTSPLPATCPSTRKFSRSNATGWTTEGWWNIASQTCETLYKGTLSSKFYYIHAIDYDRGGEWAGKSFMCTTDKTFTIRGVQDCGRRGYKNTGFFEVDTQESKDWTIRLTDPSERR